MLVGGQAMCSRGAIANLGNHFPVVRDEVLPEDRFMLFLYRRRGV